MEVRLLDSEALHLALPRARRRRHLPSLAPAAVGLPREGRRTELELPPSGLSMRVTLSRPFTRRPDNSDSLL
jgi:hypothetical protein